MKRLKDKAVRRCQQFTDDDEEFVGKAIRLIEEGSLPKATAKKVAASLKKIDELVYALYGLTPEEIKIVEGAAK